MNDLAVRVCPKVAIIVLNWNNWRDSLACLDSLAKIAYTNYDIVLLDNASEDDSVEHLKEYCARKAKPDTGSITYWADSPAIKVIEYSIEPAKTDHYDEHNKTSFLGKRLTFIANDTNDGFTGGNNLAMTYALRELTPDYVLLLNNDTVVDKGFLRELVDAAESDPDVGFAGPRIYYCNLNGKTNVIQSAGGTINFSRGTNKDLKALREDEGQDYETNEVDYVSGACMLTKKRVIDNIGMLDPYYFMFWEELDWCVRARNAGYKCLQVPTSRIWHKISLSKWGGGFCYYQARNKFWFLKKNGTRKEYLSALIFFFLYEFWFWTGFFLLRRRNSGEFVAFVKGTRDGLWAVRR